MPIQTLRDSLFTIVAALVLGVVQTSPIDAEEFPNVMLVNDPAPGTPVQHGLRILADALAEKSGPTKPRDTNIFVIAGLSTGNGAASALVKERGIEVGSKPESLVIQHIDVSGKPSLLVTGVDDRGLMYALLDTADRVRWSADPANPLGEVRNTSESPDVGERAVSIYTMQRAAFEQRFFDDEYWAAYFDMLARNRFNSFVLIFGYENGGYFAPAYPYFFDVDGFPQVRVVEFSAEQQQKYLNALNTMIRMAHDRGLEFTVGLWDHIYRGGVQTGGVQGVDPNRPIPGLVWGLSKDNLMAYSTAALEKFLKAVPDLDGVQFRMHGESGLKPGEEMRQFWRAIYQVVKDVRPRLRFDARAKEFPDELIDLALDMGINIRICTKYWAEQMGMPFHPTHINRQNQFDRRHGYADLLRYPQRYPMQWRLWSGGTTRILLWGSPEYARRFAQSAHLYDGSGFEVNEMLATKMEAQPHDLTPFNLLQNGREYYKWEFQRYWHFYQVFGRIGFNPETPSEIWNREFLSRFGPGAAPSIEKALHTASWILPRINASLFPYNRFPTTRGWAGKQRWEDLPAYANCEGSDTQQFLSFNEAARDRVNGTRSAKLHPETNSQWFATMSGEILKLVNESERAIGDHRNREFQSTVADLRILANLALYHSRRIHAGLSYALFKQTGDLTSLDDAIGNERNAVDAWRQLVQAADGFYSDDLMMGLRSAGLAGHWRDELAALEKGIQTLEMQRKALEAEPHALLSIAHAPIRKARPGDEIVVTATVTGPDPISGVGLLWNLGGNVSRVLQMQPGAAGRFSVSVAPELVKPEAGYFIQAEDAQGNRVTYPALGALAPILPVITEDATPPSLIHTPISDASPGQPLRIKASVSDPNGVRWVRLRFRNVSQFEDFDTMEMTPTGISREYEAILPGDRLTAKWDFMYLFEVMDNKGNGKIYPDFDKETPYIVVRLQR